MTDKAVRDKLEIIMTAASEAVIVSFTEIDGALPLFLSQS